MKILIVGGVAGGASAAARLRRLNENAEIIMFEKGEYISFANCGLPYYIGGTIKEKSELILQTPETFGKRFNIDVRNFSLVTKINIKEKNITVKNTKTKTEYKESYDKLILAMGAEPIKPNIEDLDSDKVFTLRNIPDTYKIKDYIEKKKPKSAVVLGGGYIGIEMAENLHAANLDVTIVEMANQIIAPLDFEMACITQRHIKNKGVKLLLESKVTKVTDLGKELKIDLDNTQINAQMLIVAAGVKPETKIAKEAGILLNERGYIKVNKNMQTSNEDIYAVGDAVEVDDFITKQKTAIPLAGPANKQGRIAADNICEIKSEYSGTQGSAIIKVFDMTVATTGINEKIAKENEVAFDKSFTYSPSHATYYPNATYMTIKTLYEKKTNKILGAQIVGFDGVDKRCDVLATAIRAGMSVFDLTQLELCYAPPYSSAKDPVNMVGYVIENTVKGKVKNFHWNDVNSLPKDGSVTLLDIRTRVEYKNGHIEGFINIPLDELRGRLNELDKDKKVYLVCQIGQRGYIGAKILMQNGYDCYNLNGGYSLYKSVYNDK